MDRTQRQAKADRYWQDAIEAEEVNDLSNAISLIDKAIALHPLCSPFWSAKGQFLFDSNRIDEAKDALLRSIALNSKNDHAWTTLGIVFVHLADYQIAAVCFRRSIKLREDFGTYTMLAAAEIEFDVQSAIKHSKRALELNPKWDEAKAILKSAKEKMHSDLA